MDEKRYLRKMNRMLRNSFSNIKFDMDLIKRRLDALENAPAPKQSMATSMDDVSMMMSTYSRPAEPAGIPEGTVKITAVQFEAPGSERGNLNGEWIELTGYNVNMTGWVLHDKDKKHVFKFPNGFTIYGTVKVYTGKGVNTTTKLFWNSPRPIWNDDEDIAILKDPHSRVVSQVRSARTHTFEELA